MYRTRSVLIFNHNIIVVKWEYRNHQDNWFLPRGPSSATPLQPQSLLWFRLWGSRITDSIIHGGLYTVNYILECSIIYHKLAIFGLSITHHRADCAMICRRVAVLASRRFFASLRVIGEFPIPNSLWCGVCCHSGTWVWQCVFATWKEPLYRDTDPWNSQDITGEHGEVNCMYLESSCQRQQ